MVPMDGRGLLIGELARRAGITPKTVRFYERAGLLPPPRRTPSGYRLYGIRDLDRLLFVRKAKSVGFSLEEIQEVLRAQEDQGIPCDRVLSIIDRKLGEVQEKIRALTALEADLSRMRAEADSAAGGDACYCAIIEGHGRDASERGVPTGAPGRA